MAPPSRSPVFFRSARSLLSCSSRSSTSGSRQASSPARRAAASTPSTTAPSGPMAPAVVGPSATMQAPVSVATSTMAAGLKVRADQASTSPSTSRPSASVLVISTVWPPKAVSTSEGL